MDELKPLFIPLKVEHYSAFADGSKTDELRLYGPRWNENTCPPGRMVVLSLGYGKKHRLSGMIWKFKKQNGRTFGSTYRLAIEACFGSLDVDIACISIKDIKPIPTELDIMIGERNRFCHAVNEIAAAIGMTGKQCYAPEAVLRRAKLLVQQLATAEEKLRLLPGADILWKCPDCGCFAKVGCICPNPECRLNHPMQSESVIGQCKCRGAVSLRGDVLDCNRCGPAACLMINSMEIIEV